jgi:hypothetical protein
MEFLDFNIIKDSSLLLNAFHIPSTGSFVIHKKSPETEKLESIRELHFVERKNEGRKPDKNSSLIKLVFMSRNLD